MLEHGGRLLRAAREYGIPAAAWLDLSTGIAPFAWPRTEVPVEAWRGLPEDDDGLVEAARDYYAAPHVLPVAGTQAAIQMLPWLRSLARVGVIHPGYAEHAEAWRRAGHTVELHAPEKLFEAADAFDVVVLIHPNNPTGERFRLAALLDLHARLAARGGWLVVDEAFMDATPEASLCGACAREGLVVLRSAGKFFGLAGARAGCACAAPGLLEALRERLGPWAVAAPTRHVWMHALRDRAWQMAQRVRLAEAGARLADVLRAHRLPPAGSCALFQWCPHPRADAIQAALARRGILTRRFDDPPSLRFGLPGDAASCARLDAALGEVLA